MMSQVWGGMAGALSEHRAAGVQRNGYPQSLLGNLAFPEKTRLPHRPLCG